MDETDRPVTDVPEAVLAEISLDETFSLLADPQRRRLLIVLRRVETPTSTATLAERIAVDPEEPGTEGVDWIRINLHHVHVPVLAEAGMVSYDHEEETVELTEAGRALAEALTG